MIGRKRQIREEDPAPCSGVGTFGSRQGNRILDADEIGARLHPADHILQRENRDNRRIRFIRDLHFSGEYFLPDIIRGVFPPEPGPAALSAGFALADPLEDNGAFINPQDTDANLADIHGFHRQAIRLLSGQDDPCPPEPDIRRAIGKIDRDGFRSFQRTPVTRWQAREQGRSPARAEGKPADTQFTARNRERSREIRPELDIGRVIDLRIEGCRKDEAGQRLVPGSIDPVPEVRKFLLAGFAGPAPGFLPPAGRDLIRGRALDKDLAILLHGRGAVGLRSAARREPHEKRCEKDECQARERAPIR